MHGIQNLMYSCWGLLLHETASIMWMCQFHFHLWSVMTVKTAVLQSAVVSKVSSLQVVRNDKLYWVYYLSLIIKPMLCRDFDHYFLQLSSKLEFSIHCFKVLCLFKLSRWITSVFWLVYGKIRMKSSGINYYKMMGKFYASFTLEIIFVNIYWLLTMLAILLELL